VLSRSWRRDGSNVLVFFVITISGMDENGITWWGLAGFLGISE
jgi:hypothetical protein